MNYAVIVSGGKQYQVSEGTELLVDKLDINPSDAIVFTEVLLVNMDGKITVGSPSVADAQVRGRVISQIKGKKLSIGKFKAKVRYRRTTGFRPQYSKIKIEYIGIGKEQQKQADSAAKTEAKPAKKKRTA